MNELIKTILTNNDYTFDERINAYQYDNKSYMFLESINAHQLEEVKTKNSLNNCDWYNEFLSKFNERIKINGYPALEKNSSLLILVESSSIDDLDKLKSQILLIEEDQFFLKKHVLIYTPSSFSAISRDTSNEGLQSKVNDKNLFKDFMDKGLTDDMEVYILVLQLFIKLPFLKLNFDEAEFKELNEKLNDALSENNEKEKYYKLLDEVAGFKSIDFLDEESENKIDNLINLLSND
ncbi:hypothetical protein CAP47_11390 [Psychroflexus sp. S27]|uniref:ABC-three component system middle component 1 n=1 Tax=Psychroflexus sp. S27 TaxID=1982757 RepID=UPI000C297FAE|nr:ABC-three component system middle component 1 [Psychroflexus sp. S27]PJX20129.1 hypothetical protein CAP47_11390 [Psychroflexus sp. S27]